MDKLSFLDGGSPADAEPVADAPVAVVEAPAETIVEPVAEPVAEPAAEPAEGPARGPDGKFVSPAPAAEPVAAPVSVVADQAHAPIGALLDERDKRQASERQVKELQERLRALETPQAETPQIDEQTQREIHLASLNTRLDISEDMARQKHGDEMVDKVKAWAQQRMGQSADLSNAILSNRNPYEKAVQEYERDQLVSSIKPGDFEAFRAWQAAQADPQAAPPVNALTPQAAPAAAAPLIAAPPPPRSIATAPSAGGTQHVPSGGGQAYDAIFPKG